ncbi:MAG: tRNA pseudouridine(38-40) synthase TruA, partial [Cyclobacteriaceae bacterium]|nr:tRNA pseudouridine(38-40) synthase TruA [Cyclobacteriaceae bacterium]
MLTLRYFFEISYKGTNYHGWQIQQNAISIQQVIQEKLKQLANDDIEITGSGRTDTGVHAKQQFFQVDFKNEIKGEDFKYHLNAILPKDILVRSIRKVKPEAHVRFDATSRSYEYMIIPHKDPFKLNEAYIYYRSLDLEKLNAASNILIGKHTFKSFSKVKTQVNNFNCEVYSAYWQQDGECVVFHIEANRFLRGMVRAIVGTLLMVNEGKIEIEGVHEILVSKDRSKAGRSVPSEGLYLSKINYPIHIF